MLVLIPKKAQQRVAHSSALPRRRSLPRFTLKSLLFIVALLAALLVALPRVYRYVSTLGTRQSLTHWAGNAQSKPGISEFSTSLGTPGAMFHVTNAQVKRLTLEDGREGWVIPGDAKKSPDGRFFIMPPGKWVNSVDEILEGWLQHPSGHDNFSSNKANR